MHCGTQRVACNDLWQFAEDPKADTDAGAGFKGFINKRAELVAEEVGVSSRVEAEMVKLMIAEASEGPWLSVVGEAGTGNLGTGKTLTNSRNKY